MIELTDIQEARLLIVFLGIVITLFCIKDRAWVPLAFSVVALAASSLSAIGEFMP